MVIVFADPREKSTRVFAILKKRCELKEKPLLADYLLSERVACERKTVKDFLQSIVDGRLFKQLTELRKNFEKPMLIIEGEEDIYNERKIHPNAVNGALVTIAIDFSIPILWTKNQLETAELLLATAKREQIKTRKTLSIRCKRRAKSLNQEQEFLISGLPKVSGILARRLLEHFNSPERIFSASEKELMKVNGIGKKLAKRIKRILTEKYEKSVL